MNLNYDKLTNHLQVGRFGEYWVKLMLTSYGLDTYYCDVDDKAIDFVVRLDNTKHIDIQVKAVRRSKTSYVFVTKKSWPIDSMGRDNVYLALVLLNDGKYPETYLIPCTAWIEQPSALLCDRKYSEKGKASSDEWGINLSAKNMLLLEPFKAGVQIVKILSKQE